MKKYRKSLDKDLVIIPGVGRVAPGQILEGPQYARFAKLGLLEEIAEDPVKAAKAVASEKKAEAAAEKKAAAAEKKAAKEKAAAEKKAAVAEKKAAEKAVAEAEYEAERVAAATTLETLPSDSESDDADPDSTRQTGAVSEDEFVVGGEEEVEDEDVDPPDVSGDEPKDADEAKMEKRADARRKKRTQ